MQGLYISLFSLDIVVTLIVGTLSLLDWSWKMLLVSLAFALCAASLGVFAIEWSYDKPPIEYAPYRIDGDYYTDHYIIKEGSVELEGYWHRDDYKEGKLVILDEHIEIEDRRLE